MNYIFCCGGLTRDMGAALSQPQEGDSCEALEDPPLPTMADVIRERKKKAGAASLGTLRRRLAAAARRPRDDRPDRECTHARYIRSVVSDWSLAEVMVLYERLSAAAEIRDLTTRAELAREPAPQLSVTLPELLARRWCCDVELVGSGWSIVAHRAILAARSTHFRHVLMHTSGPPYRVPLGVGRAAAAALLNAIYCGHCHKWDQNVGSEGELDIINNESNTNCICATGSLPALLSRVGVARGALRTDLARLMTDEEFADTRLTFSSGGEAETESLACHRVILAASSRYFRSVLSRGNGGSSTSLCVDERVLPRRFARALLHAHYTQQVDLSLIERPSSPRTSGSNSASWTGTRGSNKTTPAAMLDDAFQFYEIARFLEMPLAVQGCEDAIVAALSPETLGKILGWCSASHASQWVHRQAMRYFREEFPTVLNVISASPILSAQLPISALSSAVKSCLTQASEPQILRALGRWATSAARAECKSPYQSNQSSGPPSNSVGGMAATTRRLLAPLLPDVRLEHISHSHDSVYQAVRRGWLSLSGTEPAAVDAWLGRGLYRPPRPLTAYIDELKALLENQTVPETELARVRRARCSRIPDTLYMVTSSSSRSAPPPPLPPPLLTALPPAAVRALRNRCAELTRPGTAGRDRQRRHLIALRAVREVSLPDACADLLVNEMEKMDLDIVESSTPEVASLNDEPQWDACPASESSRAMDVNSAHSSHHSTLESIRRRELPAVVSEGQVQRSNSGGRLWRCVPDVALAPNGNTHLLPAPVYRLAREPGVGVMQLDLGDGATHAPRPGSRAQRASRSREPSQLCATRRRADGEELRTAIEMSLMRAYSNYGGAMGSTSGGQGVSPRTLPSRGRPVAGSRNGYAAASSQLLSGGSPRHSPRPHRSSLSVSDCMESPRHHYPLYRLDPNYGGSASSSRGPSPHDYA